MDGTKVDNKWEIKLKSGNNFTSSLYKTKRAAIRAFPSRMSSIQKIERTYYITAYDGK